MEKPDFKIKLRDVPHKPGVYIHKDRLGAIIYVGKARDLRKRLSQYFMPSQKIRAVIKTRAHIDSIWDFEIHEVRNEEEALVLESKLIKQYMPRYNVSLRDDKRFPFIKVQLADPFPRFVTTRLKKEDGARYFGPFVHGSAMWDTLAWINKEFGLRSCRTRIPGEADYKHCNADIIRNCCAPCIGRLDQQAYMDKVMEVCSLLEGKGRRERLKHLKDEMESAAVELNFEKAAKLRDVMQNLEKTLSPTRQFSRGRFVPTTVKPEEDLAELGRELGLGAAPTIMECFDISNVSSNHIVASMVRFTNGVPDNQNYRRYRIKTVEGQDDFASMAEVVRRRYGRILNEGFVANAEELEGNQEDNVAKLRRLAEQGKAPIILPDLVIVDGGKGQLGMAVRELQRLGLHQLPVVGLAKKREEIFFPGESQPLLLSHDTGALKLMQRIRDEAHRFANSYNELLLRKRMKESLLDDCPGMSPKRKELLLKKFGSVSRMKKATIQDIAALPSISEKSAGVIVEWLQRK